MNKSTSVVLYDPRTADPEVIAIAGFLAGYSARTREAYTLDLRQFYRAVPRIRPRTRAEE